MLSRTVSLESGKASAIASRAELFVFPLWCFLVTPTAGANTQVRNIVAAKDITDPHVPTVRVRNWRFPYRASDRRSPDESVVAARELAKPRELYSYRLIAARLFVDLIRKLTCLGDRDSQDGNVSDRPPLVRLILVPQT